MEQFSLDGRVALITGSTGGIGLAVAKSFVDAGARVAINGRDNDRVQSVAESIPGSLAAPFDVNDLAEAETAIDQILRRTGRIDILVSCVGARDRRSIAEMSPAELGTIIATNTVASYQIARLVAEKTPNPETARLIFVSSIASIRPFRGDPAYAASKAALESLVRSFCYEFGARGLTANAIAPGFVATESNVKLSEDQAVQDFVQQRIPARRWARPEEIANAAVFLASPAASYVNGHVLVVDAGLSVVL